MKVSKLSVYTLITNLFWLVDGRYNFLEYDNGQREEIVGKWIDIRIIIIIKKNIQIYLKNGEKRKRKEKAKIYLLIATGCRNVKQTVHNVMKEVKCMPRTTLMKLVLNNEYTYYPDVIPLKRCHGHCRHLTCLPIQTQMTSIALQRSHINSSTISCVTVEVEEHTQCK